MTGHDHTDALTEALRQPALPAEHADESSAVASMAGALPTAAAAGRGRPRKGVAILAVTVASLGVGGLAAAGPGNLPRGLDFISGDPPATPAAATEVPANPPASDAVQAGSPAAQPATPGEGRAAPASPKTPAGAAMAGAPPDTRETSDTGGVGNEGSADDSNPLSDGPEPEQCVEDGHGRNVADATGSRNDSDGPPGEQVRETARPDCADTGRSDNVAEPNPGQPAEPGTNNGNANPATGNQGNTDTNPNAAEPNPGRPADPGTNGQPTNPGQPDPGQPNPGQPTNPGQPAEPNPGQPADPGTNNGAQGNGNHNRD